MRERQKWITDLEITKKNDVGNKTEYIPDAYLH